jgi:hypothetical protein
MLKIQQLTVLKIVLFMLFGISPTVAQSDWKFNASIYGWFAGIDGTVGVASVEEQIDATPSDLFNNLDFTLGGHFEASNPKVSLIADVFYMGLGRESQVEKTIGRTTIIKNGSLDLDEWVAEAAFGYRLSKEFEVLLATRFYDINVNIQVDDTTTSNGENWFDGFIGARYMTDFADNWFTSIRTDIGLGGSNFAWFGNAELGYRFSELFALSFNYRILSVDYEVGSGKNYFKYDTFNHGFGLAAIFSF